MVQTRSDLEPDMPPCYNKQWCPKCAYLVHCIERQGGERNKVRWPAVALTLLVVAGLLAAPWL